MIAGRQRSIGIGRETTWGTPVVPATFFNATESISEERGRLREEFIFGSRSTAPADPGRLRITGSISGIHVRPRDIGHILRAATTAPSTSGTVTFTHVFTPTVVAFSSESALTPYSITVRRSPGMIHRYTGGNLTRLSLQQERDGVLTADTEWIARGVSSVADTAMVLETGTRFRYRHLAVTRNAVAFPHVESLRINLDNALETEENFNQTDEISAIGFGGNSSIAIEMTLRFQDAPSYTDFSTNAVNPWVFTWTIDANNSLAISIPRLNIGSWGSPTGGPGRMTIDIGATAEFDSVAGHDIRFTLVNNVATY